MKRLLLLAGSLMLASFVFGQGKQTYFLTQPCLTPDARTVIFSYESDLWKADVAQGQATRVTAMPGYEFLPRVSPDGKWLAFSSTQAGNADVYVMPIAGGEIRRLTFHSGADEVSSWSWDSRFIYFTHSGNGGGAYKVALEGTTPVPVFGEYFFAYEHLVAEHPVTGELFFNDTWESDNQASRKRYKGPYNPDIQSYNPRSRQYTRYTTYEGKDFHATLDRQGRLYFISDENNGEYNLYTLDGKNKKALTKFNTSIKSPVVSANGEKVVFERDYHLWVYDVRSNRSEELPVTIIRNELLPLEKDFNVRGAISYADVSPDGKKMAFISRGELFVSDVEGKFIRQLVRPGAERASEVKWLADNRTLLFSQTKDGYRNWYTMPADGKGAIKELTSDERNNRQISLNKDRSKGVYYSGRDEVRILDLKSGKSSLLAKDELWALQTPSPHFAPDDDHVLYTVRRNFEMEIQVHQLSTNKARNLTRSDVSEVNAQWSPDGRYIYFSSTLLRPYYPLGFQGMDIYRMPLEKWDSPFRQDMVDDLFKEEKKDTASNGKAPAKKDNGVSISINEAGIMDRLESVGPQLGTQMVLKVIQRGKKTIVLYISDHAEGNAALWKTVYEPFENPKTEKIAGTDRAGGYGIIESGDKLWVLFNGIVHTLNVDASKVEPLNMSYTFRRRLNEEFKQMFEETWAHVEENFYDEKFHGTDWKKMKERYQVFLPYLNTRDDLRKLLNDMLGELNSSHQGFATFGQDEQLPNSFRTMETGIVFDEKSPYTVSRILANTPADRKGVDIRPGDQLVAVNGQEVNVSMNRDYYFTKPSLDNELSLRFRRGQELLDVRLHTQASLYFQQYDEWIQKNQQRVNEWSKSRIAYGYMKNMGQGELNQFLVDMTRELNEKDGLILDLRYNTGGNVHDELLRFLSQRSYLQWKYRGGKLTKQSNFSPSDKPIVLLINEQSLSDAEMTAEGFKALKLGTVIGMPTYRWIIFTSGTDLVDNSFVRLPSWGCYSLDGRDLEMEGVAPDIQVANTFEDRINDRDPQLQRAVQEIQKKWKP